MIALSTLILFFTTFVLVYLTLTHIEYKMWEDWFEGKKSWWNILYKNRGVGMTTERFEWVDGIDYEDMSFKDNLTNKEISSVEDLIKWLNELHEENQQLKGALKELKEIGDYQAMRIKELEE